MTDKTEKPAEDDRQVALRSFIVKHISLEGDEILYKAKDQTRVLAIHEDEEDVERLKAYWWWVETLQSAITEFMEAQDKVRLPITEEIKKRIARFEAVKEAHIKDLRALDDQRVETLRMIARVDSHRDELQALLHAGKEEAGG